jgi:hypothetical protein
MGGAKGLIMKVVCGIPAVERKFFKNNHLKMGISARGGLEPAFRVLFSAIFHGVSPRNFHQGRKRRILAGRKTVAFCGGSTYKFFICIGRSAFARGYQKSKFNSVLSAHHSFAAPISPGLWHAAYRSTHPGRLLLALRRAI